MDDVNYIYDFQYDDAVAHKNLKVANSTIVILIVYSIYAISFTKTPLQMIAAIFAGSLVMVVGHYFITKKYHAAIHYKNQKIHNDNEEFTLQIFNEDKMNPGTYKLSIHKIHKVIVNYRDIHVIADVAIDNGDGNIIEKEKYEFNIYKVFNNSDVLENLLAFWEPHVWDGVVEEFA